jgi:asparagine N-glycosylation enzyme membrane subunit Stt3
MKRKLKVSKSVNIVLTTGIVTFFTSALFMLIHIPLNAFGYLDWMYSWVFAWAVAIAIMKLLANKIRRLTLYLI